MPPRVLLTPEQAKINHAESVKKYKKANPERYREYDKIFYHTNKEAISARRKIRRQQKKQEKLDAERSKQSAESTEITEQSVE